MKPKRPSKTSEVRGKNRQRPRVTISVLDVGEGGQRLEEIPGELVAEPPLHQTGARRPRHLRPRGRDVAVERIPRVEGGGLARVTGGDLAGDGRVQDARPLPAGEDGRREVEAAPEVALRADLRLLSVGSHDRDELVVPERNAAAELDGQAASRRFPCAGFPASRTRRTASGGGEASRGRRPRGSSGFQACRCRGAGEGSSSRTRTRALHRGGVRSHLPGTRGPR